MWLGAQVYYTANKVTNQQRSIKSTSNLSVKEDHTPPFLSWKRGYNKVRWGEEEHKYFSFGGKTTKIYSMHLLHRRFPSQGDFFVVEISSLIYSQTLLQWLDVGIMQLRNEIRIILSTQEIYEFLKYSIFNSIEIIYLVIIGYYFLNLKKVVEGLHQLSFSHRSDRFMFSVKCGQFFTFDYEWRMLMLNGRLIAVGLRVTGWMFIGNGWEHHGRHQSHRLQTHISWRSSARIMLQFSQQIQR